jgi:hypothetical protein
MDLPFPPLMPVAGSLTSPLPPTLVVGERTLPLPRPMFETPLPT